MPKTKLIKDNFSEVAISLSSPEDIISRSWGEVNNPNTKNHRTHKSEEGGLCCPRIFGPEKDWICTCGKLKGIKFKGNICDNCGVEVNEKRVRRMRMGHIKLEVPVVHTWFFRYHPYVVPTLLNLKKNVVISIIEYGAYIVIQPGVKEKEGIEAGKILTVNECRTHQKSLDKSNALLPDTNPDKFIAQTGAKAIETLLKKVKLDTLSGELRTQIEEETDQLERKKAIKRLSIVEAFRQSGKNGVVNKPENMILYYIPVMAPDYRPVLSLNNGRFATSDTTELLKRVVIRNNSLKKLHTIKAPDPVLSSGKRMIQEIVDGLYDNSPRHNTITSESGRPFKSLADGLKGKEGVFRSHLLAKRVDYSGRSVITVGPTLKLYECGLPKEMALVLFEPFLIQKLKYRGLVKTFKEGRKLIEKRLPVVWRILDALVKGHPVLLNRAPTLHRLGIQAFFPKLVEGRSIHLHPLVCAAYNADFDGDQMAVHLPLSQEAIAEASMLLLSSHNMLNPSNGEPITLPSKDMVLGLYYLTSGRKSTQENPLKIKGAGMHFSGKSELLLALNNSKVSKQAHIKLDIVDKEGNAQTIDTVAGRLLFNECLPKNISFINETINSKNIRTIVGQIYDRVDVDEMVTFLDSIKSLGFKYAYEGGLTFGVNDMIPPKEKKELIQEAEEEISAIQENYEMGFTTENECFNQKIDVWTKVGAKITKSVIKNLKAPQEKRNSIYMMVDSGARGSRDQIKQLCGWRGIMSKSSAKGGIIEQPIISSFHDGLSPHEYFISTNGSRKGLADTTLKTADAGYFTRRLIDVAQAVTITERDCTTLRARTLYPIMQSGKLKLSIGEQVVGRVMARNLLDTKTKKVVVKRNMVITTAIAKKIDDLGLRSIQVRSPIFCEATYGICIQCYGINLGNRTMTTMGDVVGNVAAQSISEPGTQLTLRTFHTGGAVAGSITEDTIKAHEEGIVSIINRKTVLMDNKHIVLNRDCELNLLSKEGKEKLQTHIIPYGATLLVDDKKEVKQGESLFEWDPYKIPILAEIKGKVIFQEIEEGITYKEEYNEQTGYKEKIIIDAQNKLKVPNIVIDDGNGNTVSYVIPPKSMLSVEPGDEVVAGAILAKIARPRNTPQDIVGGLPRVTKLFEMQRSLNTAVMSAIDGTVKLAGRKRGKMEVLVTAKEGLVKKYKIPYRRQLLVQDGDYVKSGHLLSDGFMSAKDILQVKGINEFCNYMINEVQDVYRLQGVRIDDKHMEIILRQMLQNMMVISAGDTVCVPGILVSRRTFYEENKRLIGKKIVLDPGTTMLKKGQMITDELLELENKVVKSKRSERAKMAEVRDTKPAIAHVEVQGITASAMHSESFIAQASFQETIKTLVKSVIAGKVDKLHGIKENVVMARVFPAGTGLPRFKNLRIASKEVKEALMGDKKEDMQTEELASATSSPVEEKTVKSSASQS